jgi:hypothetical protein
MNVSVTVEVAILLVRPAAPLMFVGPCMGCDEGIIEAEIFPHACIRYKVLIPEPF